MRNAGYLITSMITGTVTTATHVGNNNNNDSNRVIHNSDHDDGTLATSGNA